MGLLNLKNIAISFGSKPLFSEVDLTLEKGQKICLIGSNGSGKTTLLKIMAGIIMPDKGERSLTVGTKIAFLPQAPDFNNHKNIISYVSSALSEQEILEAPHFVDDILDRFNLNGRSELNNLSGGEKKRVDLAKTLIASPDILFLDEPTNHLDLPTINIIEKILKDFKGSIIIVSHDRAFLANTTNGICWLHNHKLWQNNQGFSYFEEWSESILNKEENELNRMQTKLKQEMHWLNRGVTARRKRNQGRLKKLYVLRQETAERKRKTGSLNISLDDTKRSSKMIVEAEKISKTFGDKTVIKDFSIRITRGERIGIIGANGIGKTTLIKMLTGNLLPDKGSIRLGDNLKVAFFDQHRNELNPEATLKDVLCPSGGDYVVLPSGSRHIAGYLKDFLFSPDRLLSPVKILSGGEKNRLMLALKFLEPCNLLVMDEPTNDLDIETLDLLEEVLSEFDGTLIIVSHDRDFLDKTATSVLAFEDNGIISEYVGGYTDYLNKKAQEIAQSQPLKQSKKTEPENLKTAKAKTKLNYNEQRELELLPSAISKINAQIKELEQKLANPCFYNEKPKEFELCTKELEKQQELLEIKEKKWLELEMLKEELEQSIQS